jgi:hypothetical protein
VLLDPDVPNVLADVDGDRPAPARLVHFAVLVLTHVDGLDETYSYLTDRARLESGIRRAIESASGERLWACAMIEEYVYGQPFLAATHGLMAVLTRPSEAGVDETALDRESLDRLADLASDADVDERNRAAAQIATLLRAAPSTAVEATVLLNTILSPAER